MRLQIKDLQVRFGDRRVVSIEEFSLGEAEIVGLAGESGSGKSMTTLAILGLAHTVGAAVSGSIRLDGTELTRLSQRELRERRGRQVAAIFQSPAMAFSPVFRVGQVVLGALRLHLGRVAESGPTGDLLERPVYPYTQALRSAVPEIDWTARRSRVVLPGEPPNAVNPPPGCVFHPRCPLAIDRCRTEVPVLPAMGPGRLAACHRAEEVLASQPTG